MYCTKFWCVVQFCRLLFFFYRAVSGFKVRHTILQTGVSVERDLHALRFFF